MTRDIEAYIAEQRKRGLKVALVTGIFNAVHLGHVRLLEFAKAQADILIVGVVPDSTEACIVPAQERIENVSSCRYVDYVFLTKDSIGDTILELKPDLVVKGAEHKDNRNDEVVVEEYGGELLFASGDINSIPIDSIERQYQRPKRKRYNRDYLKRHGIEKKQLVDLVERFKHKSVLVIGDIVVDEYVDCKAIGLSKEDPTIAVLPKVEHVFLGAAGIVAAHSAQLTKETYFVSVRGDDVAGELAIDKLNEYGVEHHIILSKDRKTTTKRRYRAEGKTLLRVNDYSKHRIGEQAEQNILAHVSKLVEEIDLIILSDFNYGLLPQSLVDKLISIANEHDVAIVADSQASSQISDISRFHDTKLLTPTEYEARLALKDDDSSLSVLADDLLAKTRSEYVAVTLGESGVFIAKENTNDSTWFRDQLGAINPHPVDVAGAGDLLLVFSSLALTCGADIWTSMYLGNIAAAIQVSRVGNLPISSGEILTELQQL